MKMSKIFKTMLLVGALSLPAFADMDIQGQIVDVNNANKTITISGINGNMVVQVFPYTKLKGDDCGIFGNDTYHNFTALKPGMFVEIEGYPQGQVFGAQEIEWKCGRRAY
ncbi:DUF5666 domain-containing protein [Helicobacter sp. MIT 05-5294]|uniref:DUF5666 domain-containing protein n=1 Tax=Helicobacter sp. MIT 05-5294 TaxID=1548150 RepID=UPI0010FDDE96|nr:DUF5666 domain-containing protein [Helicobacter sp. MIT 05-5294]TLD87806.1 hypothetical protein LS69_003145 [Helicobacter sp. MIT 05-5294]